MSVKVHKDILQTFQTSNLKLELNKVKNRSLDKYDFAKLLNDIGNILNINIIFILFIELKTITGNSDIFSNNLKNPSTFIRASRSIKTSGRIVSNSVKKTLKINSNSTNKPCNKSIIGKINSAAEQSSNEIQVNLIKEFNNFINNKNCLDVNEFQKRADVEPISAWENDSDNFKISLTEPYTSTLCVLNDLTSFTNKQFLILNKEKVKTTIKSNFNINNDELNKSIDDIIEFYFGLNPEFKKIKIPNYNLNNRANDTILRNRLKTLKDFTKKLEEQNLFLSNDLNTLESILPFSDTNTNTNTNTGKNNKTPKSKNNTKKSIKKSLILDPLLKLQTKVKLRTEILHLIKLLNLAKSNEKHKDTIPLLEKKLKDKKTEFAAIII